ncbi:MAG: zinc-ribbon domain-containing protein [Chloroflexi bacterium]|nr:MAG: zinc-ribbon domain-containing protein [Chloroflexota bacterium]
MLCEKREEVMPLSASKCISCGASNPAEAKFCPACGYPMRYNNHNRQSAPIGSIATPYVLNQRFRVMAKVGQGGFGAVYKAEDIHLENVARAIKEMNQESQSPLELQQEALAFKHEAVLLASLMHPNLPRIYDHFEVNGRWYLVMDYIEGETLASRLQNISGGKLPVSEVLHIGIQLAIVLGYLHTRQPPIIFRDLKPANVMITADNHLYLIDFGIARLFKPGQTKDTQALGSPGYAAPEQYGRAQTTEQADIYSLGVTLHQLLSGYDPQQDPFHLPPLILEPYSSTGRALETLITGMAEMAKEKRPATMQDVKQELQRIAQAIQQPLRVSYQAPASPHIAELKLRTSIIVDQHGRGDYTRIGDAIKKASCSINSSRL